MIRNISNIQQIMKNRHVKYQVHAAIYSTNFEALEYLIEVDHLTSHLY